MVTPHIRHVLLDSLLWLRAGQRTEIFRCAISQTRQNVSRKCLSHLRLHLLVVNVIVQLRFMVKHGKIHGKT